MLAYDCLDRNGRPVAATTEPAHHYHMQQHEMDDGTTTHHHAAVLFPEDTMLSATCHETLDDAEEEAAVLATVCGAVSSVQAAASNGRHFYWQAGLPPPPDATLHNMRHYGRRHFLKMREAEGQVYAPDPTYEHRQVEVRPDMRAQLLDWLMEVGANFFVHRRTFQAAVNYCDRFLSKCQYVFPRHRLQLLAITALFVAAKTEEVYPPKAHELAEATAGAFSAKDVVAYEKELMMTLGWNLTPPTADDWAEWYLLTFLERGLPETTDAAGAAALFQQLPRGLTQRLQLILDLALLDVTSLHFYPSMLAAAGLYLLLPPAFYPALAMATGHSPHDKALEHCKAYLTFLSAGLLDTLLPQQAHAAAAMTVLASPRTQAALALVPLWDRHSLQGHPAGILPHLLGRIAAVAGTAEEKSQQERSRRRKAVSSSFVVAEADAVSPPTLLPPPPSFLGCRSVSMANLMEEEDEEDDDEMEQSEHEEEEEEEGSSDDSSVGHETEGEADDEDDGYGADEDFFGHSLELHDEFARAADPRLRKQKQQQQHDEKLLLSHRSHSHHSLTLGEDQDDGNELLWSSATTTDPQTTRDSLFSFFPLEEKDEMEGAQEAEEAGLLEWLANGDDATHNNNKNAKEEEAAGMVQARSWKHEEASMGAFFFPDEPAALQRTRTKAALHSKR